MERYDIPPPTDWEDFEDLCRDLWALLWEDPDTCKHGRRGQRQVGVDVYGRPHCGAEWKAVQCKLKSQIAGGKLTRAEILDEVAQARTFEPALAGLILATTAPRDAAVQAVVRQVTEEQLAAGSFPITVFFWDDILEALKGHESLLRKHYWRWRYASEGPSISIAKLPATGETFVAREEELARLDAAWAGGTNVISFVAMGGAGKSALVNRWLGRLQEANWRGAERVLGWSFYSQGTDAAGASSEAFTEFALGWLGYQGEPITSPWKKGEVLARLIREARTLLVLDGLEPLQHPPGAQTGRIKDPAVQALVKELVAENPGLCVITTRLAVTDVAGRVGTEAVDLEELPAAAGAELLRRLGVEGSENELRAASEELGGHGLALTLLGTYLRDICDGDVRRRREATVLDEAIESGKHARQVMASYESWFGLGPELQVLHLLGLFDRPAEGAALEALRASPGIPRLTEGIGVGEERAWKLALARLRQARLVAPAGRDDADTGVLDAHPLVREHFGERLRESEPEAWRAGNERLYEHYRRAAPEYPETLEAMLPLYAAVVHGCRAGREQETLAEVYRRRIMRGDEFFSIRKLGVLGTELTALAAFFDRPWDRASARIDAAVRGWLFNQAGFVLRSLGRLPEAVQPTRATLEITKAAKQWRNAAASAINLSELTLTLGKVADGVAASEEGVDLADRSGIAFMRMAMRTTLADALHQAGQWKESAAAFREAEAIQVQDRRDYLRLYSVQGYQYGDLLLSRAEPEDGSSLERVEVGYREVCEQVRERASEALDWETKIPGAPVLDFALHNLSLGRARLGLALTAPATQPDFWPAAKHLDQAIDGLRQAGTQHHLPRGLLARAALRRLASDFPAAASDLREAQEIAERGSMRLFEADAHLEWTRLHLATGEPAIARRHLDRASILVRACGYGRREREVTWLEGRLSREPGEVLERIRRAGRFAPLPRMPPRARRCCARIGIAKRRRTRRRGS